MKSTAGHRAVVRWALRLFRREWRQQVLVLALVTMTVGAAVAGSTLAVNAASDGVGQQGNAPALVRIAAADGESRYPENAIADARDAFGTIDVIAHRSVSVPGSVRSLDVRDTDPNGVYSAPMVGLRAGRLPTNRGEVALTRSAADLFGASIGSTVELATTSDTVVGIVENPAALDDVFALVAPGTLDAAENFVLLVDPADRRPGGGDGTDFGFEVRGADRQAVAATVLVATTLAMVLVGLVASAAFVVVAQRRQRQLGLLAATGATRRQVQLVMMADGFVVGLAAAVAGTAIGIGAWMVGAPAADSVANRRIDRWDLPWTLIIAVMVIAVVMSTVAAWWPARVASRRSVMSALSGRPPQPQSVSRSLPIALALLTGGMIALVVAAPATRDVRPLVLIGGVLLIVVGMLFVAPAAVRLFGVVAPRLPFAPRLALRDLARYQGRSAAALAAITLGLGICVATITVASANQFRSNEGDLSDHELLISVGDRRIAPDPSLTAEQVRMLDQRAGEVAAALGTVRRRCRSTSRSTRRRRTTGRFASPSRWGSRDRRTASSSSPTLRSPPPRSSRCTESTSRRSILRVTC